MINDKLYIDLAPYVDVSVFDSLHPEISRGIATARDLAIQGLHTINEGTIRPDAQGINVKPLYEAYSYWQSLPDTDPIKIAGQGLDYNQLTTYLKYALGAYDSYTLYTIVKENSKTEFKSHFPNLTNWVLDFLSNNQMQHIHSAILMVLDSSGIPWEHQDPEPSWEGEIAEFIHIKTDLDRPFYMVDPNTNQRVYINTRVAWWDETDWHGGEPINKPTYTLRITGTFTEEFRQQLR